MTHTRGQAGSGRVRQGGRTAGWRGSEGADPQGRRGSLYDAGTHPSILRNPDLSYSQKRGCGSFFVARNIITFCGSVWSLEDPVCAACAITTPHLHLLLLRSTRAPALHSQTRSPTDSCPVHHSLADAIAG